MSFSICTIGCGWHAREVHGPSYRKYARLHPDVYLAACCDTDAEKAQSYQHEFQFHSSYTDVRAMLEQEKPDAVCLIVPAHVTFELAMLILELGYPLLLEKPPGLTKVEVERLAEMAESRNIPHMVAFNRRFEPLVIQLKTALLPVQASEIHHIQYELCRINRPDPDFSITAIHAIDTLKFIAGADYHTVRFSYQPLPLFGDGVANCYLDGVMASGTTFHIVICPVSGLHTERATIHLTNQTYILKLPLTQGYDFPGKLTHLHNNQQQYEFIGEQAADGNEIYDISSFYEENRLFFEDIRAGRKPVADLISSIQSVEIAEYLRKRLPIYKADHK
jgi:myo-inositol 2-dehydrogenase/D-chiro-inositol 1-dehydrogenase